MGQIPSFSICLSSQRKKRSPLPHWLKKSIPAKESALWQTNRILRKYQLSTVCEEAKCPNRWECYAKKSATFLALGRECTRSCGFCAIASSKQPPLPDAKEPEKIARATRELELKHVVITMVARDDLADGGAEHMASIVSAIRRDSPNTTVELLTSDFFSDQDAAINRKAIERVLNECPDVFNHNVETVRRLSAKVRHKATYERSLSVLENASRYSPSTLIKSGLMVGLGESHEEVRETMRDLKQVGCQVVTIGQYLPPADKKFALKKFISPEDFEEYAQYGRETLSMQMFCGPFVRSSYHAGEVFSHATL